MEPEPASTPARRSRLVTLPFAVVTLMTFCYFTALGSMLPTLPKYVEDELGGNGLVVGVVSISAAVLRPWAGRLGDRKGRRLLCVGGCALAGVSILAYTATDDVVVL